MQHQYIATIARFLRPRGLRHWISAALAILSWVCVGFSLGILAVLAASIALFVWASPHLRDLREQQAGPAPVDPWQRFWHWSTMVAWRLAWGVVATWVHAFATPWRGLVVTVPYVCYTAGFGLAIARFQAPGGYRGAGDFLQVEAPRWKAISLPSREALLRWALYGFLGTSAIAFAAGMLVIALTPPA
jgi:hypothetical protein